MNLEPNLNTNLSSLKSAISIQIPAKTFLVGEYAALAGGDSLCMATKPYFTVHFNKESATSLHEKSASSLYLKDSGLSPQFQITSSSDFKGIGLSTAEFIAAWIQVYQQKSDKNIDFKEIYKEYLNLYSDENQSSKPSGVDLLTQLSGRITSVAKHNDYFASDFKSSSHDWPFNSAGFYILSTGYKENTHTHLTTLDRNDLKALVPLSNKAVAAFLQSDWNEFLGALKTWSQALHQKGLTCDSSLKLKTDLEKNPFILLAKPCGARGADTILVFFEKQNAVQVQDYIKSLQLSIIAGENDLANGVLNMEQSHDQ